MFQDQCFRFLLKHWPRKLFLKCDVTNVRLCPRYGIRESFLYRHEKLSCTWLWTPVHTAPKSGTETYPMSVTIHFQDWRGPASFCHTILAWTEVLSDIVRYTVVWTLGRLNKDVFERRKSSGTEAFSLLTCLDSTKFVFPNVFSLIQMICLKIWSKSRPKLQKRPLPVNVRRLKTLLLKRYCLCSHGKERIFGRLKIRVCRLFRLHGITSIVQ